MKNEKNPSQLNTASNTRLDEGRIRGRKTCPCVRMSRSKISKYSREIHQIKTRRSTFSSANHVRKARNLYHTPRNLRPKIMVARTATSQRPQAQSTLGPKRHGRTHRHKPAFWPPVPPETSKTIKQECSAAGWCAGTFIPIPTLNAQRKWMSADGQDKSK